MYPEIVPINALGAVTRGEAPPQSDEANAYPSGTFFINVLECVPCGKQLMTRKQNPIYDQDLYDNDYDDEGEIGTPLAPRSTLEYEAFAILDEDDNEYKYESFGWDVEYLDPDDVTLPGELRPLHPMDFTRG
jgi:hypothetical protein